MAVANFWRLAAAPYSLSSLAQVDFTSSVREGPGADDVRRLVASTTFSTSPRCPLKLLGALPAIVRLCSGGAGYSWTSSPVGATASRKEENDASADARGYLSVSEMTPPHATATRKTIAPGNFAARKRLYDL